MLVRHCQAAGGVQITASHNPLPYNGIKLFSAEGRVIPADLGEQVLARYRRGESSMVPPRPPGTRQIVPDPLSCHLASGPGHGGRRRESAAAGSRSCWIPTAGRAGRWAAGSWKSWAAK